MNQQSNSIISADRRRFVRIAALSLAAAITDTLVLNAPAWARRHIRAAPPASGGAEEGNVKPTLTEPYATACVMEPSTGTVILDKDMHKPWPTASLAKMMLTLIVVQKLQDGSLKLTDKITCSRKAQEMGGSQVYLAEGEVFTLDDLMKAIMVHSANDACVAVAEYIAGSTEAFVVMMNQEVAKLGLQNTHYYSVHGLPPARGQQPDISSAYDLAEMARVMIKYPDVLRWAAIDTAPFRNGTFILRNTNHLVRTFPGCDGLKTGFYYAAGFNVVATAHRNGLRLIAVVLGSPRKNENFAQAGTMMSEGFAQYEMRQVAKKDAPVGQSVAVTNGAVASIKPVWGADASIFVKRDDAGKTAFTINYKLSDAIAAPVKAGQRVGTAEIIAAAQSPQIIPLVAPVDVAEGTWWQRLSSKI
jgi:serine-type D-Ala-D-Ala carboxypeptidase (penicillin-binding protein 5/6)